MRCPHCAGEISDQSRFCGICGRYIDPPGSRSSGLGAASAAPGPGSLSSEGGHAAAGPGAGPASSMGPGAPSGGSSLSLFELPVSRGARIARVAAILALDAVLIGAGIAMIISYMNARDRALRTSPKAEQRVVEAEVQALPPEPVRRSAAEESGGADAVVPARSESATARERSRRSRPGARRPAQPSEPPTAAADAARKPEPGSAPPAGGPPAPADGGQAVATDPVAPDGGGSEAAAPDPSGQPLDAGTGVAAASAEEEIELLGRRIAVVVEQHKAQLERCYRQAAKGSTPSEPLQGRVVIQFGIMPDGQAQNARAVENSSGSERLATCVAAEIQGWGFPSHSAEGALEFRWPFVFKAPK